MKKVLIIIGTVAFGFIIPPLLVIIDNPKSGGGIGKLGLLMMGISLRVLQELMDAGVYKTLSISLAFAVHFITYLLIGICISKVVNHKQSSPISVNSQPNEK